MKSRNLAKIVTLILSCALLIGAVVGISSIAEETEESNINIVGANVAYEGAVQVVYYVEVKDATKTPYVLVSYEEIVIGEDANINELGSKVSVKKQAGTLTANDVDYPAFYSNGIAPKELRKDIYAVPVLADENGNIVEVGDAGLAAQYSPYTYAMRRFGQQTTPAQVELYKALLNYGAAVQAVLDPDTAGTEANPWADEYWDVTIDGTEYIRGNLFDGTYTADRFNAEGESFTGWTDAEGATVVGWTTMTFKPGVATVLNSNYAKTPEGLATFDDGTLGNATTNATAMANKVTEGDNKSSDAFYEIKDGYFVFEQYNDLDNGDGIKYPLTPAYATTYVYEADFNITEWDMSANAWLHKFAFWNSKGDEICNIILTGSGSNAFTFGGETFALNEWHHIKLVMTVAADGTLSANATLDGAVVGGAGFQTGVNNDYRVANAGMALRNGNNCYTYNSTTLFDNVVAYAEGNAASYDVTLDANGGECAETYNVTMGAAYELPTPVNGDLPFVGWYIGDTLVEQTGTWNYIGKRTVEVDGKNVAIYGTAPTLVAKWATPVNVTLDPNGGSVSSTSATVYTGQAYELPTPERAGLIFGGWYDAEGNFYAANGTWAGETDVTLTARWYIETAGLRNDFENGSTGVGSKGGIVNGAWSITTSGWNPSTYFAIKSDASAVTGNTDGTKYIFEADFTYVGGASNTSGQHSAFLGFIVKGGFGANGNMISSNDWIQGNGVNTEEGDAAAVVMYGQTHVKGETYRIRYEYVVGEGQYINVYVDGAYKGKYRLNNSNSVANVSAVYGFDFVWRGAGGTFTFDNTYCGIVSVAQESNFTLDAGYGTLPENAKTEWTLATGESYTLPTPTLDGFVFAGWSYGDTLIATSGKWISSLETGTVLEAKWMNVTTTTLADKQNVVNPDYAISPSTDKAAVDAAGTTYIFSTDYTYHGLTSFTVTDGVVAAQKAGATYAYVKFTNESSDSYRVAYSGVTASGDFVNAMGEKVTDETGKLLDGYTSLGATDIFYKNLSWGGFTFEIGKTYNIEITIVMNGTTGGAVSGVVTDADGNEKSMSFSLDSNKGKTLNQFRFEGRGASSAGVSSYKLTQSFENASFEKQIVAVEGTVTLDPNGGTLAEGAATSIDLLNGMKLPELPVADGGAYAFAGWYNGDTLVNSGDVWAAGNATLVAKYLDTTSVQYDPVDATVGAWAYPFTYKTGNTDGQIDAVGTKYIYSFDFTYEGASYFTLNQDTGAVAPTVDEHIGFFRIYAVQSPKDAQIIHGENVVPMGNYVDAAGNVVVNNGVLVENSQITDANQIFFSQIKFAGIIFDINETYKIKYEITVNGAGNLPTLVLTATDESGNVQSKTLTASGAVKNSHTTLGSLAYYTRRGTTSVTCENANLEVIAPVVGATVTLDANGGTLPEGAITGATVLPGATVALPTPTNGEYKFGGWYNGDTLVDNNYVVTASATLTAKWLDVTTTEFADVDVAVTNYKTYLFTHEGYTDDEVAVSGTKYTFTTDFTYKGLASVTGEGTAESPITAINTKAVYAYMGFTTVQSRSLYWQATASGDFVTFDEETGTYVKCVDENGVFLDGFNLENTPVEEIYFSNYTWAGMTFEIGKTYTVEFTTTIGTVTVTNGVVSATAPLNVKPTATDAEGNVQTGVSANLDAKQPYYQIKGFMFEVRGTSTGADRVNKLNFNCTFANSTVVEEVPVTDAAEIKATWINARTPIPGTTKYNTKYFGLVKGAEYTIDAPVAVDGYTVTWYLANSSYVATASELPTTGTWNGTVGLTYAVAVYTEIPAEETPAEGEATE